MTFYICINNKKAFSLLELTIVVIIMTVLLTFAVPSMYRAYLEKAGTKTALEIQNIQDAARSYYLQKGAGWPSSINTPPNDLESSGYLPSSWNALNPFNHNYTMSSTSAFLTVSTTVNDGAQNIVVSKLPLTNVFGTTVTSTISVPGGPTTPPVFVVTGTIEDRGTIPLPSGYTDAQCQWLISSSQAETYDSSGKGGCENDQYIEAHITNRVVSAYTHGDCRRAYISNSVNYIGICANT
ncbi:MAG: type II secretion system protein [Candidatus Omnitrophica bacterium]|nr:type II secretion system protein [Candidatus Omnitrophota bacterium]